MYGTVRSWKSSIMNLTGTEWSELYALYLKNCYIWLCLHSIICIYRPVSTKLGQNIYVQQNLNEFDYGSNWTGTTGVICSWIVKKCCIRLGLLSNIYKYKPISTKLGHNDYEHRISNEWLWVSHTRSVSVICPWNRKIELQWSIWYLSSLLTCTA